METSSGPPVRLRTAIVLSIAFHCCGLALLAIVIGGHALRSSFIVEETRTFAITTITRRVAVLHAPAPRTPPPAVVRARPVIQRPHAALMRASPPPHDVPRVLTGPVHATVVATVSRFGGAHETSAPVRGIATGKRTPSTIALIAAPPPAATTVPTPTQAPTQAPTATPAPPTAAATPAAPNNFGGLFSQNYPPALASPAIVQTIHDRTTSHGRIRIDVDETGHATEVRFIGSTLADPIAHDIRAALLDLTYIPADCNGLHCDGTLELNY